MTADDDLATLPGQPSDRGDNRGGPAGEHLGDLAARHALTPLIDGDTTLLHREAEIACQLQDRGAGHSLEDGAGQLWRHDAAVAVHEEEIHPAELFNPLALHRIQERDLVAALGASLNLCSQTGRIVPATLGL